MLSEIILQNIVHLPFWKNQSSIFCLSSRIEDDQLSAKVFKSRLNALMENQSESDYLSKLNLPGGIFFLILAGSSESFKTIAIYLNYYTFMSWVCLLVPSLDKSILDKIFS